MTAQQKVLAAPILQEAINGFLYVGQLGPVAHGGVEPYPNATVGDKVEFTVQTSTGNSWKYTINLTQAMIGNPIDFAIPKATFAEKLKPGATATLRYTITRLSGNPVTSQDLIVRLEP